MLETKTRRSEKLRGWCEDLKVSVEKEAAEYRERSVLAAESFRQTEGEGSRCLRVAKATAHIFKNMPLGIRKGEILAGWHPNSHPDDGTGLKKIQEAEKYLGAQNYWVSASEGHMAPDYPSILGTGLDKIKERIIGLEKSVSPGPGKDFYKSALISIKAFQEFILRYAELAAKMEEEETDSDWKEELGRIRDICRRISSEPARNFREAVQLSWFVFLGVALENGNHHACFNPGHIDRYLLPYYMAEKASGELDDAEADAFLDQLFIKCNEFLGPSMSAVIVGIAGRNPDGTDAASELSFKSLESSDRVRMYYPGIDIMWHEGISEDFMKAAFRLLKNGMGQPSFFNFDLIAKGLKRYNIPFEHAVDYLPSTCTEASIQGRTNPWVAWPYVNIPMSLLHAMFDGCNPATGKQEGPKTGMPRNYEELKKAFMEQIERLAGNAVSQGVNDQKNESLYRPFPLLSCFVQDCLKNAKDISNGGATYNFLQPEAVGISNAVDSLAAIKTLTGDNRFTLDDFRSAIKGNFEGCGELERAVLFDCPKYGNNTGWVNDLFAEVAGKWCSSIEGSGNFLNGPVFPGFLGWTVWIQMGRETPATPDGRKAGVPLANSIGPCTGVKLQGILSMLLSSLEFDQSRGLGGTVFNLRFSSGSLENDKGIESMKDVIETAFRKGLYQVQINITGTDVLKDAQEHPENFQNLLIRIGGYLVPFTLLPRDAQDEVVARAEMGL
ncbi:hypothetical protein CO111_00650 [Candidatus Desantisbacteria bacterium CG_4_9_14_3_um_filter_50_7]|nr:MAG: hypothetical protein CO111_00650 [Candidatus Desantisbacteria bacterium CG_4_9_14_3_um_filter_50_7]